MVGAAGDEETQAVALLAALNTALAPKFAYDYDEVPSPRPKNYVAFSVTWRFGGEARNDGYVGTDGARVTTTYVSESLSNARLMRSKVVGLFRHGHIVIADDVAIITRETGEPIEQVDGWFTGYDDWTFTV